jgi:membrane dipeptidase
MSQFRYFDQRCFHLFGRRSFYILYALGLLVTACGSPAAAQSKQGENEIVLTPEAQELHELAIVVDGHNDLPWNIRQGGSSKFEKLDISKPQENMHTDIPRLRKGGLDVQFWSVWVPASTMFDGNSLSTTLEQIEIVKAMMERYPETFELALNVDDIRRITADGKIASLIGVEGGHSIENSLGVLRQLYEQGARYMTLTHSISLDWADSATDKQPLGGLSAFGEEVVREMNRLGFLVDLSHVSPDCMKDALRIAKAPVIFSHSSAKAIADHPRNVPDDVLKLTAENGGVVMVNFYSGFIVPSAAARGLLREKVRDALQAEHIDDDEKVRGELRRWDVAHPVERGTIHSLLDHVDHIVKVAGVDHVGLGSDYDGIPTLPKQLEDVSSYPYITQGLLDRGYSHEDIQKILGGNLLRAFAEAERVAKELSAE